MASPREQVGSRPPSPTECRPPEHSRELTEHWRALAQCWSGCSFQCSMVGPGRQVQRERLPSPHACRARKSAEWAPSPRWTA